MTNFKAKSKKTGVVREFFEFTGKLDSNKKEIFEGANLTIEYLGENGSVVENYVVRKSNGEFRLFDITKPESMQYGVLLSFVPFEMKITLIEQCNQISNLKCAI